MPTKIEDIEKLNPCHDGIEWLREQKSPAKAWQICERGDWMLWLIGKQVVGKESKLRKRIVLCACDCARLALKHVPEDEHRPLIAIETAEAWANGGMTTAKQASAAAADAAYAAACAAAAYAAAAYAAATYAAAAAAAADAAAAATRGKTLAACAAIVRRHFPRLSDVREDQPCQQK